MNMLPYMAKVNLKMREGRILDYHGGLKVIPRVLTRGRQGGQNWRNVKMETETGQMYSAGGGRRVYLLCCKVGCLVLCSSMLGPVGVYEHTAKICRLVGIGQSPVAE